MKQLSPSIFAAILIILMQVSCAAESERLIDGTDGQQHALSEYVGHGKWVVVNVWATACPYCRHELDDLIDFHNAHHDQDAMVLGLTLDFPRFDLPDSARVANFASDHFIDYPLLLVDGEIACEVIGEPVDMVPLSFFYNPAGQLVHRLNGMVTVQQLEAVIQRQDSRYRTEWADVVPPEYVPSQ